MLGPLVNSGVLVIGAVTGALLGRLVPRRVKEALPLTCGTISLGIGAVLVNKVQALPAVALALIAGALIGELLFLERGLELAIKWVQRHFQRYGPVDRGNPRADGFIVKFVTITVLLPASTGTGASAKDAASAFMAIMRGRGPGNISLLFTATSRSV